MRRTGQGRNGLKNRNGKCEGPGRRGGDHGCLKRKVFLKNQKHQPNIVEITHLCIMHEVHTSTNIMEKCFEDQVLYILRHNEVRLRLESCSNLV